MEPVRVLEPKDPRLWLLNKKQPEHPLHVEYKHSSPSSLFWDTPDRISDPFSTSLEYNESLYWVKHQNYISEIFQSHKFRNSLLWALKHSYNPDNLLLSLSTFICAPLAFGWQFQTSEKFVHWPIVQLYNPLILLHSSLLQFHLVSGFMLNWNFCIYMRIFEAVAFSRRPYIEWSINDIIGHNAMCFPTLLSYRSSWKRRHCLWVWHTRLISPFYCLTQI